MTLLRGGDGARRLATAYLVAVAVASGCGDESGSTSADEPPVPCKLDAECDGGDPCSVGSCGADGHCEQVRAPDGEAPVQVAGDCARTLCSNGLVEQHDDEGDVEDDGSPCTLDRCREGVPEHEPSIDGVECQIGNGVGACTAGECVVPCTPDDADIQCDDDNPCTQDGCIGEGPVGECAHSVYSGPTPGFSQALGDCHEQRCVEGVDTDVVDDFDVLDDDNPCTADTCTAGTPENGDLEAGAECDDDSGGRMCDGRGNCVECLAASDCADTIQGDCVTATCSSNDSCVAEYLPEGTPVPATGQQPGDCKTVVCDGSGGTDPVPAPSDAPDDMNACTLESCDGDVPTYTDAPQGTPCPGDQTCDGKGTCCTAATCQALGKNCGGYSDFCGGNIYCGACATGDVCGASVFGVCGCTDGIQNGNETGIDCGGPCPACLAGGGSDS